MKSLCKCGCLVFKKQIAGICNLFAVGWHALGLFVLAPLQWDLALVTPGLNPGLVPGWESQPCQGLFSHWWNKYNTNSIDLWRGWEIIRSHYCPWLALQVHRVLPFLLSLRGLLKIPCLSTQAFAKEATSIIFSSEVAWEPVEGEHTAQWIGFLAIPGPRGNLSLARMTLIMGIILYNGRAMNNHADKLMTASSERCFQQSILNTVFMDSSCYLGYL